mmetsp:Transcript_16086/g.26268  ORF Transcript_16086/g.26268 Transcript_16086/m.26268 type:complete len:155 (-) Transcript_16086:834-1298(-)
MLDFSSIWGWVQDNLVIVLVMLFVGFKYYQGKQPFPVVEGSRVVTIESKSEFEKLVEKCKKAGALLLVDYYATWCPPCRAASPVYQEMSKGYDDNQVIFAKVNVDDVKELSSAHGVSAMPTFKIFNGDSKEVFSLQGWNEDKLRLGLLEAIKKE